MSLLGGCWLAESLPMMALEWESASAALPALRAGRGTGRVPMAFTYPADFPQLLQVQPLPIWAWGFLGLCWESLWNFCFAWVGILASVLCPSSPLAFYITEIPTNLQLPHWALLFHCGCGSFVILVGPANTWERNKRPQKKKKKPKILFIYLRKREGEGEKGE